MSQGEQDLLDEYSELRFHTTKLPYGIAIQQLISEATDIDVSEQLSPTGDTDIEN